MTVLCISSLVLEGNSGLLFLVCETSDIPNQ